MPQAKTFGYQMPLWRRVGGVVLTFNLVCLGWLMFRAESMQTVALMLHQIFSSFNGAIIPQVIEGYSFVFVLMAVGYLLHLLPTRVDDWACRVVSRMPMVVQLLLIALVAWCVMQVKSTDIQPFIYFQF